MARPTKDGLDYFPHDVDAANDEKIESLMYIHGTAGYAFYFIHLERIYRSSTLELDISESETMQILAKKCGINFEEYEKILQTCLRRNCFDAEAYQSRGVLTSNGIKKRANVVISKREKMRLKYNSEVKKISDAETREKTPQSKEKKSKEKKSIESNICIAVVNDVIDHLNSKCNKSFKASTKKNQQLIKARINEGYKAEDLKKVIEIKALQWLGTEFDPYLRPETLFGSKFESYLNEKPKQEQIPKKSRFSGAEGVIKHDLGNH